MKIHVNKLHLNGSFQNVYCRIEALLAQWVKRWIQIITLALIMHDFYKFGKFEILQTQIQACVTAKLAGDYRGDMMKLFSKRKLM